MVEASVIGFLLGLLTGLRFKVLALVPLELVALFVALSYGVVSHSLSPAFAAFAVGSLALQSGYLVAAFSLRRFSAVPRSLVRIH